MWILIYDSGEKRSLNISASRRGEASGSFW